MAPVHPVNIPLPLPLTPSYDENDNSRLRRRRSSTVLAITNWALAVQPGSPAPISPNRRLLSHRRVPSNSPSFLHIIDTPTTANRFIIPSPRSAKDFPSNSVDLTSLGYTSVFVRLPLTPSTPAQFNRRSPVTPETFMKPGKTVKKFKSMGILRRSRSKSVVGAGDAIGSPTSPTPRSPSRPRARSRSRTRSGSVSPTKPTSSSSKAKPGSPKPKSKSRSKPGTTNHPPLPPALQTELLLMQFTGGGSLETNAQRLMEHRAAKTGNNKAVDAVYKDENGVMWLDEDERVEYQALLPPPSSTPSSPASPWIQFSSTSLLSPTIGAFVTTTGHEEMVDLRRGSVKSLTPTERELEAARVVRPTSPSAYIGVSLIDAPVVIRSCSKVEERRRKRPAPLKLCSAPSGVIAVVASPAGGFEDSFEPSSAEIVAIAAGMRSHAARARRARKREGMVMVQVGGAPVDVIDDGGEMKEEGSQRRKKMTLAKRARALFGKV